MRRKLAVTHHQHTPLSANPVCLVPWFGLFWCADPDSFDNRSDEKGPEPEGLVMTEIDGRLVQSSVRVHDAILDFLCLFSAESTPCAEFCLEPKYIPRVEKSPTTLPLHNKTVRYQPTAPSARAPFWHPCAKSQRLFFWLPLASYPLICSLFPLPPSHTSPRLRCNGLFSSALA